MVCCLLCVVFCSLLLLDERCLLCVVCSPLSGVCCLLLFVCRLYFGTLDVCLLFIVACCLLCIAVCGVLFVVLFVVPWLLLECCCCA